MDALMTLVLLAVLLAAPCLVQLVLWTAYAAVRVLTFTTLVGRRYGAASDAC